MPSSAVAWQAGFFEALGAQQSSLFSYVFYPRRQLLDCDVLTVVEKPTSSTSVLSHVTCLKVPIAGPHKIP
jgi:hypothetical protein